MIATVYIGGLIAANQSFFRLSSSDCILPVVIGSLMPSGTGTAGGWLSLALASAEAGGEANDRLGRSL